MAKASVTEHHCGAGIMKLLLVARDKGWDVLRVSLSSNHGVAIIIQTGLKVLVFLPDVLKAIALVNKNQGQGLGFLRKLSGWSVFRSCVM